MPRVLYADILAPAIKGLDPTLAHRIAIAGNCAILFGALERAAGHADLQDVGKMEQQYAEQVALLKTLQG